VRGGVGHVSVRVLGSWNKLLQMDRLALLSPILGETDAPAPVRAKEWAREGGCEDSSPGQLTHEDSQTPHLSPLPSTKGRGERYLVAHCPKVL